MLKLTRSGRRDAIFRIFTVKTAYSHYVLYIVSYIYSSINVLSLGSNAWQIPAGFSPGGDFYGLPKKTQQVFC